MIKIINTQNKKSLLNFEGVYRFPLYSAKNYIMSSLKFPQYLSLYLSLSVLRYCRLFQVSR